MKTPASFPSAIQVAGMEANRYSPDNVLLHDPSSRRRNKLHLTSPSGLAVVSEVVAVFGAVIPVGFDHRGQIAISVPVSAALGYLRPAPVYPAALLLTATTVSLYLISPVSESAALRPKLSVRVNPDLISLW